MKASDLKVINIDDEQDEHPLNQTEEEMLNKVKDEKYERDIRDALDRVYAIKAAIEVEEFQDIFIKPIRGNIKIIKDSLETADKTRDIAVMQGELKAYKKMLNFPSTAIDALDRVVKDVKENLPLFSKNDTLLKEAASVRFDEKNYRIIMQ
jgi:hypothetical protein